MTTTRLTVLLTGTVIGTYLLLALGATTASIGAHSSVAGIHYGAAVLIGLLLVVTAAVAWLDDHDRRVALGITAAAIWYPVQAGIGLANVAAGPVGVAELHLLGGVGLFGLLLLSLVAHLDREVSAAHRSLDTSPESSRTDDDPESSTEAARSPEPGTWTVGDRVRAYVELTKPRLMWLLCLLALAGMGLAAIGGAALDGVTVVATLGGGVLAIGASGTFNHVFERERDQRMDRTADRPVATQSVPPGRALAFGLALAAVSTAVLWTLVNPLATLLTATAIGYYSVVYTVLLKPNTRWNTAIGGGSGALPALIGWAAVTGEIGLPAVLLAAVVVLWTPAHFYNLAIAYREDYAAGEYPMLPVVAGVETTRRRTVYWLGGTLVAAVALARVAELSQLFVVVVTAGGALFVWSIVRQFERGTDAAAYRTFHTSNAFLGLLLVAILVEAAVTVVL